MKKRNLLVISTALLVILACSLDSLRSPTEAPSNDPLATSVASTFEENDSVVATSVESTTLEANNSIPTSITSTLETNGEVPPPNTDAPTSLPTMTQTPPPVAPPTASLTPTLTTTVPTTSSVPIVSVSVGTNCRTGPGQVYDIVGGLRVGENAEVVGKKTSYNYWIIKNPDADGNCWLWGKYATVLGDTSNLEEYALPPILPSTASPTPSLTPMSTATVPTTSSVPIVSVSVGTNCRTGPGQVYDIVGGLRVGENAEVVGKKTSYNYWIIKNPDADGNCWLWGKYATVLGDTSNLEEYALPPIPPSAASPTASLTPTPTAIVTTTPSAPIVSVSVGTNCRTGPGKVYDIVGGLRVGENAEVVGKKTSYNYWIIKNLDANGDCWLWGYYATVIGDTSNLQEYIIPPIPTPTP